MSWLDLLKSVLTSIVAGVSDYTSFILNNTVNGTLDVTRRNVTALHDILNNTLTTISNNVVSNISSTTDSIGIVTSRIGNYTSFILNSTVDSILDVTRRNVTMLYDIFNGTFTTSSSNTVSNISSTTDSVGMATNNSIVNQDNAASDYHINTIMYVVMACAILCMMRHICHHFMQGVQEERRVRRIAREFSEIREPRMSSDVNITGMSRASICCDSREDVEVQQSRVNIEGEGGVATQLDLEYVPQNVCHRLRHWMARLCHRRSTVYSVGSDLGMELDVMSRVEEETECVEESMSF
ncbi:hypothetical protein ECHLIB_0857 [Ehrlichia chaffeensis str. Liberty]|uniref:hypothetical protein n=1 Tax=Ehrlichia chaffeensis TaxID=945 RepID=UPI000444E9FC|nr:hypothetical protein [Ehrlichia chaffeensis]AHX06899.1 hypothetical protein ECHLIB_0857 [Ehrlichia chaffeensis str. Liberty]